MLKTLREEAGLTQEALAERSGLPLRSIQNWEQGHRVPRVDALPQLARAIGVPVDRLVTGIVEEKLESVKKALGVPRRPRKPKGK
jgi:transcriptional regulator with XRE-family HTH domain